MCIRDRLDYARQYERVKDNALAADTVKLIYEHGTRAVSYTHLDVYKRQRTDPDLKNAC